MYQWIESIRVEEGIPQNLDFHQQRVAETLSYHGGNKPPFNLRLFFNQMVLPLEGVYKLRLLYGLQGVIDFSISRYELLVPKSFELIEANELEYSFKNADRKSLMMLKNKSAADEIIILKNGFITDTSYSNLVFLRNERLYTPDTFLLNGTMRQKLLSTAEIERASIKGMDLDLYSHFKMINAMRPLDVGALYPINLIING